MFRVALLSPSLSHGDAVTNDVLGMADALKKRGHDVRLFCESHALKHTKVFDFSRVRHFLTQPDDVLIYHYSMGWQPGLDLLQTLRCKKVIKYHNVTPADFFHGFSANDEELCRTGRAQLSEIVRCDCDLFLSASAFNMRELIALGADVSKSFVAPPFHRIGRLAELANDEATLAKYSDGKTNILTVGRVAPHKGHLSLLEAFAQYYFNNNRNARLIVVGKGGEGLSSYSQLVHKAAQLLGLKNAVVFAGGVSEAALKTFYLISDAFVTTSEHEGFCVPLVEAMSMRLPISAFASTAIPETLGDAGVVWEERDPLLISETLALFAAEPRARTALAERGLDRYQTHFAQPRIEKAFFDAWSKLQ